MNSEWVKKVRQKKMGSPSLDGRGGEGEGEHRQVNKEAGEFTGCLPPPPQPSPIKGECFVVPISVTHSFFNRGLYDDNTNNA